MKRQVKKDQPVVQKEVIIKGMTIAERFLDQIQPLRSEQFGNDWPYIEDNVSKIQNNLVGWCMYYPRGGSTFKRHVVLFLHKDVMYKADGWNHNSFIEKFVQAYPHKQIIVK